jgi:superfamily II DNA or RNA helicase/predicted SprT family Zn-dependent metalloprotease
MERNKASSILRQELDKHGLNDWKVRLTTDPNVPYLGLCSFKDKAIILNAHHCDIHPDAEIIDTIKHEIAHALVGIGHAHDEVWRSKAKELGCNGLPCSHLNLPAHIIDAIRSGATVEMSVEEEVVTIRTPTYRVTRLQDLCETCGKVAVEKSSFEMLNQKTGNMEKWITLECFHVFKKVIPKGTPFHELVSNDWKPEVKNCKHVWGDNIDTPATQCTICNEYKLFQFQIDSAKFNESGLALQKGVLNAHEMGLGKTWIALSVIRFHPELTPTLYVVKSKTKFQWLKEIMRILGPSHLGQIINTSKDTLIPGFKTYLTSYDLMRRLDREKIKALGIKLVILDECQQIKNVDSGRTQQVRRIVADPDIKIIALSGTPWKNRGEELFPIMNMISPTKFHSQQDFLTRWVDWYMSSGVRKQGGIRNIPRFKEYTKDLIIRYEYDEVMADAPAVKRMKLPVQLDEIAQESYDDATSDFVEWYNQHLIDGTADNLQGIELLAQMARMRHITGLAKIAATLEFCDEFYENTDRSLVIFVHHIDVAYHLVHELKKMFKDKNDVIIDTLSSSKTDMENNNTSSKFNTNGKRWFIIAGTLSCGEGIDGLQKGCDSVLHERQWNPQNEDQATPGRFKRIGQKSKTVNITCVEADETIDADLDIIVERKRKMFHELHNKGMVPKWDEGEIAKELAQKIVERFKKKGKVVKNKNIKQLSKPVKANQFTPINIITDLGI